MSFKPEAAISLSPGKMCLERGIELLDKLVEGGGRGAKRKSECELTKRRSVSYLQITR